MMIACTADSGNWAFAIAVASVAFAISFARIAYHARKR